MTFEWDEAKNLKNIEKHQISFEDAQNAFYDIRRITIKDKKHSKNEDRFFCIGMVNGGIATVRFTMRDENIRIFGAGFWREGREKYEEKNNLH
ncbi:MAG: BrnT family toxin [Termitinemataceae bacterium]|nr:MAG: BrnT family toxin [Termitinemataceae bacterium]